MKQVLLIAQREFVSTVFTKGFVIALLVLPAMICVGFLVGPRLFTDQDYTASGEVAIIDPTGQVAGEMRAALTQGSSAARLANRVREARAAAASGAVLEALGAAPQITLIERPVGSDIEAEKVWLRTGGPNENRLALVIVHPDAVDPSRGETGFGSYDIYVPPKQDTRAEIAVHQSVREAIVSVRVRTQGFDRDAINELVTVPRVQSVTVSDNEERETVGAFNMMLPFAFMFLLLMSVMGSGQGLLTTMIEEKSSRVVEVLLSAVSPMQLMAGKLLGHMGISLLAMSLYIGLGLLGLASFSLFGLLDPSLIFYLFLFFVLSFFMIGSLMMAAGAAVNELREAQSLMMPMMLILMAPWFLWVPISRDPNSTLSVVASFIPPVNTFAMLLRMASTSPPPAWQVWLSVGVGVIGVIGAVWVAAKIFRIGLLMFGKPPDFRTLVRWVRSA
jgi:ABC-type Na+ efflux pump permease subunit